MSKSYSEPDSPEGESTEDISEASMQQVEEYPAKSSNSDNPIEQSQTTSQKTSNNYQSNNSTSNNSPNLNAEWQLLNKKIQGWLGGTNSHSKQVNLFLNPALLVIGLLVIVFLIKAYTTILVSLETIPLAPSIFKVVGTFWLIRFFVTRLMRQQDRDNLKNQAQNQWKYFFGSKG